MVERGSYVAIMPTDSSAVADVLEIDSVIFAGGVYIQLLDGRMYATIGGKSFSRTPVTFIVPATDEHWAAFRKRENAGLSV
jgi:hypothetical protein